ncbi:MAG: lysophospholipid acyltransferase family protein [Pseudomonadota bacterium]
MDAAKAGLIKLFLTLCARLPLSWARAIGRGIGYLAWPLGGRNRKVTERNIELAFPELSSAERRTLARRSLIATSELAAEMGHVWLRDWDYVRDLVVAVEGQEQITEALAEGRGVIVLAPHLGNWEMIGLHLPSLGSVVSLYEPPHIRALEPIIRGARERSGATLVPTDARGLARLLKSVKGGNISGILPDQAPGDVNSGENSPFMGVPSFTGTLAVNMIRRTGALAVFGFAKRIPGGFHLYYLPADAGVYDEDTHVALAAMNRGVEGCVRYCEEQYQWEYKRFRVRPAKGPGVYDSLK